MEEAISAFVAGGVIGIIFTLMKLPVPVPPTLAGIMGIIGIFIGFILIKFLMKI